MNKQHEAPKMSNIPISKEFQVAIKTVNSIFTQWQLNEDERHAFLTDTITIIRLSRILNIYRLLGTTWEPHRAVNWLRTPNDYYNGKSALEVISETEHGLEEVQQYLKYQFQDIEKQPAVIPRVY